MKYKVLIPQDITAPGKDYLKEHGCEIKVLNECSTKNICDNVSDCDAILARTCPYSEEVFACAKKLKVISRHGVGYDNIDMAAAKKYGVKVCYTPEANSGSVAEHTMALLLACAKKIPYMDKLAKNGDWALRNNIRPMEVSGKTIGIIGYGRIGKLVAKKAALGFDMKVLILRHHPNSGDLPDYVEECFTLGDIFSRSDFLSLHSPLTKDTEDLVNYDRLKKMKKAAYIINTARGAEVNEDALYRALTEGLIAGAALDVFKVEPPEKDNPLLSLDNVIISPHNAALTKESMDRMGLDAAVGIMEVLNGQTVSWLVE